MQAQLEPVFYRWNDEETSHLHVHRFLMRNAIGEMERATEWNPVKEKYTGYVPALFCVKEFAGKNIKVEMAKADDIHFFYSLGYNKSESFEHELDSIFSSWRKIHSGILSYDSLGRINTKTTITNEHKGVTEWDTLRMHYSSEAGIMTIRYEQRIRTNYKKADYSSIYSGNFKGVPLTVKAYSDFEISFDADSLLTSATATYRSYANKRKNSSEEDHVYSFDWNGQGRLVYSKDSILGKSEPLENSFRYEFEKFDSIRHRDEFPLLATPVIKRWVRELGLKSDLIVGREFSSMDSCAYLMLDDHTPIIMLRSKRYFGMAGGIYDSKKDSLFDWSYRYWLYRMPDMNDTIPYRPRPIQHSSITFPVEVYSNEYYRPSGVLDNTSGDVRRRGERILKDGWRVVSYGYGSNSYGTFVPGLLSNLYPDPLYESYLFFDATGMLRYYYDNHELYKVNVLMR
jgi:hypothetical protein